MPLSRERRMEQISTARSHGGVQGIYRHKARTTDCDMTFSVFVPPQAARAPAPVLWYLSGLTCTHANVTEKGEYRGAAAAHGVIVVCPDTSPRGDDVPDDPEDWRFGKGAGFYLDATRSALCAQLPHGLLYPRRIAGAHRRKFSRRHEPARDIRAFHGRPRRSDHGFEKSRKVQELLGLSRRSSSP